MEQQFQQSKINWPEIESKVMMHFIKRLPLTVVKGKGMYVWDDNGKKYLDFVGGWAVNSLGHCHPVMIKAAREQVKTLIQASNQYYTVPQLELAKLLIDNSCFDKAFFGNSGAEANEGATKLARKFGKLHLNGAYQIITTTGSFHGRTLAMVAATGQTKFQEPYVPLPDGFVNVEFNNISAIMQATNDKTCAVMVEPIQGEGGVNVPDKDYLKQVRDWCTKKGILLILDEVQTGIGRIGSLFGFQQFDVEPDIITLAKGLGGGVPIGAILAKEKAATFVPGEHGSTFGGNPLICAISLAVLQYIIENDIPKHADDMGQYLVSKLEKLKTKYKLIKGIRGMGLLIGVILDKEVAEKIVLDCMGRGLLINNVKPNVIRFMPPLIATKSDIDKALNIFEKSLNLE
jgi:acetylornithine/N-succinyldiaminopimelate aminotransferase